jgi:acyl-CoA reductase-like NAD-dependent aldehyde dehydrogenase
LLRIRRAKHRFQRSPWLSTEAGIPAGVFNVVTGQAPTIVEPWTKDTRVRALSFTGSTEIGRLLYRQSADTVKKLVLNWAAMRRSLFSRMPI